MSSASPDETSSYQPQRLQKIKNVKLQQHDSSYSRSGCRTAPHNSSHPMCLARGVDVSNEAVTPSRLKGNLNRKHPNNNGSDFKKFRNEKATHNSISVYQDTHEV